MVTRLIYTLSILFFFSNIYAQLDRNSDLYQTLLQKDSLIFELGFNQCDLEIMKKNIAEDLRFYHDLGGVQKREEFLKAMETNICGNSQGKPLRKVDPYSIEVHALYNNGKLYGAIQTGEHEFWMRQEGKAEFKTGSALFTHTWLLDSDEWKLHHVLSYDHKDVNAISLTNIDKLIKDHNVPAVGIGIIEDGQLTQVEVHGTLDQKTIAPHNTIFKVASLTKPLVALLTLKLADAGLLGLDEPLYKYWIDPDIADDPRHKKITPRMVLSHQTGFPNWRYLDENGKLEFKFDPGTQHLYSGEGFEYLRKAMEQKLGRSLEDLAEEYIFDPLEMRDTRFWWDKEMDETRYARNFDKEGKQIETHKYYEANAAANVLTTVEDYGRFMEHVINGGGLSDNLYTEMLDQQVQLGDRDYFGLSWEILTEFSGEETALLHTGKDPGVTAIAVLYPKSKNGFLMILNGDNFFPFYEYMMNKRFYLGKELWKRR